MQNGPILPEYTVRRGLFAFKQASAIHLLTINLGISQLCTTKSASLITLITSLIPVIFGQSYAAAGPIFIVLLFGQLVYLASMPIHMSVFYYFSYPKLFFWVSLGHLTITGAGGWVLISQFGAMGAAFAVLLGSIFNLLVPVIWVLKKIKSRQ